MKFIKTGIALSIGLLLVVGTGCQTVSPSVIQSGVSHSQPRWISPEQLAAQLNLNVVDRSAAVVSLKNDSDIVLIFTHEKGQFSVNGRLCGPVGPVTGRDGALRVEDTLVERIKPFLNTSSVTVQRLPRWTPNADVLRGTIMIDAGHGGHDTGAISCLGYDEKDITLRVATYLAGMLQRKGFRTILTRDRDQFIELDERCAMANRTNPDLFISIHADSCDSPSVTGYTAYIAPSASWQSRRAAQGLIRTLAQTGMESRGVKTADYRVLVNTNCPAVLIEMGYLSNAWEAKRLQTSQVQQQVAAAIAQGIDYVTVAAK